MTSIQQLEASGLLEVRETQHSGRGVYARTHIASGTLLLATSCIAASVIYREFRREVCAQCFAYDRGRSWKIRSPSIGLSYCCEECRQQWLKEHSCSLQVLEAAETLSRVSPKVAPEEEWIDDPRKPPSAEAVEDKWEATAQSLQALKEARFAEKSSKQQRRLLQAVLSEAPARDALAFLASGVACQLDRPALWESFRQLVDTPAPYRTAAELKHHASSLLKLAAGLPLPHLDQLRVQTARETAARTTHNAFNIWSLDVAAADGGPGSECLGYGVWPDASYWNHSCRPNIKKRRVGREWRFWSLVDIQQGEELCISYLGGDEADMSLQQRQERLLNWGFACACTRCNQEAHAPLGV